MSGMQNISFGALTAKNVGQVNFENFDLDKDGIITQSELETALGKEQFDLLDLSSIDKNADQKVTQEEYELWTQEAEMLEYLETLKTQAARDLVGQDADDIKNFVDKLTEYEKLFVENYTKTHKNINGMAADFVKDISKKYTDIKKEVMTNTKTAVMSRVVDNVINIFLEEDKKNGNAFLGLVEKNATSLSDNARRLLTNELTREAEKFIKRYEGENLEADLTAYLKKYLSESDKEKLADAIGLWEKGKEELKNLPEEIKFLKLKAKAKNLLMTALENDISLKVGDIIVRSEAAVPAALGQFKDSESIKWAFDKAISELSRKTRAQEIKEQDEERKAKAVEEAYKEMQAAEEEHDNFFKL